jgi:hypothetical protein
MIAKAWTLYNERNSDGAAIMPHMFAALALTDCAYLANMSDPVAAADAVSQLMLATGVPSMSVALVQSVYSKLASLLQPVVLVLQSMCNDADAQVKKTTVPVSIGKKKRWQTSASSGSSSSSTSGSSLRRTTSSSSSSSNGTTTSIQSVADAGTKMMKTLCMTTDKSRLKQVEREQCARLTAEISAQQQAFQVCILCIM